MKKTILKYISQLILIVFSVVLGLYLSERLEERKNNKDAAELLSKIKSEVKENKKILEYWLPYHEKIAAKLDSLVSDELFIKSFVDDESALFRAVLARGTLMGDYVSNDAWDIAKSHPLIVNFDYDELLALSRIYNQQVITFEPLSKIIDLFLSPDFNAKENAKSSLKSLRMQMNEFVTRESQLMNFYNGAENILNL